MKKLLLSVIIAAVLLSCKKENGASDCEGCRTVSTTFIDEQQISRTESNTPCGTPTGVKTKTSPMAGGKILLVITSTTCN